MSDPSSRLVFHDSELLLVRRRNTIREDMAFQGDRRDTLAIHFDDNLLAPRRGIEERGICGHHLETRLIIDLEGVELECE
jgi:hypothetical protein